LRRWTPNALDFDVDTNEGNVMVLNQNYDPNWRLRRGNGHVFSAGGLVGVALPPGGQHLQLAYTSYPFLFGAALTMLTLLAAVLVALAESRPAKPRQPAPEPAGVEPENWTLR
jgi:uncharacterized membrane protein YfhO